MWDRRNYARQMHNVRWKYIPGTHPLRYGDDGEPAEDGLTTDGRNELRSAKTYCESRSAHDRLYSMADMEGVEAYPTLGNRLTAMQRGLQ